MIQRSPELYFRSKREKNFYVNAFRQLTVLDNKKNNGWPVVGHDMLDGDPLHDGGESVENWHANLVQIKVFNILYKSSVMFAMSQGDSDPDRLARSKLGFLSWNVVLVGSYGVKIHNRGFVICLKYDGSGSAFKQDAGSGSTSERNIAKRS
jgi:hypothetical protein